MTLSYFKLDSQRACLSESHYEAAVWMRWLAKQPKYQLRVLDHRSMEVLERQAWLIRLGGEDGPEVFADCQTGTLYHADTGKGWSCNRTAVVPTKRGEPLVGMPLAPSKGGRAFYREKEVA